MLLSKALTTLIMLFAFFPSTDLMAKGGLANELGFSYKYDSLKAENGKFATHSLQGFYLVPAKAIWAGAEFEYGSTVNASYSTNLLDVGGLIKYWVMEPGSGFAFNMFAGLAFGQENDGFKKLATMTMKAGPEFAYFVWDGLAISTRVQYQSRKADKPYTGLGIRSGLTLFF